MYKQESHCKNKPLRTILLCTQHTYLLTVNFISSWIIYPTFINTRCNDSRYHRKIEVKRIYVFPHKEIRLKISMVIAYIEKLSDVEEKIVRMPPNAKIDFRPFNIKNCQTHMKCK